MWINENYAAREYGPLFNPEEGLKLKIVTIFDVDKRIDLQLEILKHWIRLSWNAKYGFIWMIKHEKSHV